MRLHGLLLSVLGGLLFTLTGCGTAAPELPPLTAVSGTVTLNGQPTEGITVIFHPPLNGSSGPRDTAFATTDENGKYTLQHSSGEPGIEPGEYTVTFSYMAMPDGSPIPAGAEPAAVGAKQKLPGRYLDPERTTESALVTETTGTFDFALQSR